MLDEQVAKALNAQRDLIAYGLTAIPELEDIVVVRDDGEVIGRVDNVYALEGFTQAIQFADQEMKNDH